MQQPTTCTVHTFWLSTGYLVLRIPSSLPYTKNVSEQNHRPTHFLQVEYTTPMSLSTPRTAILSVCCCPASVMQQNMLTHFMGHASSSMNSMSRGHTQPLPVCITSCLAVCCAACMHALTANMCRIHGQVQPVAS